MYYLFIDLLVCLQWKNHRFTAFLDSKIHTRLAIVTANALALAFPPRNLPKKFRPDPSTFYLVIVVTNKQTNRQTYAGDYIILAKAFAGITVASTIVLEGREYGRYQVVLITNSWFVYRRVVSVRVVRH